jgi:hypothetical protein
MSALYEVEHLCLMVYEMSDTVSAKKQLLALRVQQNEMQKSNRLSR